MSNLQHDWNLTITEATAVQKELASHVKLAPYPGLPQVIAGTDISFNRYSPTMYAGFVVYDLESKRVIERAGTVMDVKFPYVPGYLSFREIPPLLKAWKKLRAKPPILMVDGQGIAHPRGLGIASHLGVLLGLPTIGCGKSKLVGKYEEPGPQVGDASPLLHQGKKIGTVLRTKERVKPLFISPGHLCDHESAVRIVLASCTKYRLPEPTRLAHEFVNEIRRAGMAEAA
jgi:deoxyribonuclease V